MSSPSIGIFVATMTGLAELCAEEVSDALAQQGFLAEILLMDGLGADVVERFDMLIIISSTYGHGDIPDNGQGLFTSLKEGGQLTGKQFAIFALGDRTFLDTFCHAGDQWDELLAAKGAIRITTLEKHDASAGTLAEDEAGEWALAWGALLRKAA
jgi:MioC protein